MNTFKRHLTGKGLSNSTVQWYNRYVLDFLSWLDSQNTDADNANSADLAAYLGYLKQRGLATSRRVHLIAIKHYYSWQITEGKREDNPAAHIKLRGTKTPPHTYYPGAGKPLP
jgi:site-specific recombinase XerD